MKAFLLLLLPAVFPVVALAQVPQLVSAFQLGKPAPKLHFQDLTGKNYRLDSLDGKVIVMNFWNIGCTGCERERPTLNRLRQKFADKPVVFLSITGSGGASLVEYLEQHPITYKVIERVDFHGLARPSIFNFRCMPTSLIIDANRIVSFLECMTILPEQEAMFAAEIEEALVKKE